MNALDSVSKFVSYARKHPVGKKSPGRTAWRILSWQLRSRSTSGPHRVHWIGNLELVLERGLSGATGNLYYGLHEFADMAFMLHFLRREDLFVDIGANVGTYTILAAGIRNCRVLAFEPDEVSHQRLVRNIAVNKLESLTDLTAAALGSNAGEAYLTSDKDAMNSIVAEPTTHSRKVQMTTLDAAIGDSLPAMLKIDVEGFEPEVIRGASRTLLIPSLNVIEIETVTPKIENLLSDAGFREYWYEPSIRLISEHKISNEANNHLYIRDLAFARHRVAEASAIDVFGWKV
jgi:FkbM family methyltransferase